MPYTINVLFQVDSPVLTCRISLKSGVTVHCPLRCSQSRIRLVLFILVPELHQIRVVTIPILKCIGSPADIYVEVIDLCERSVLYGGGSSYHVRGTWSKKKSSKPSHLARGLPCPFYSTFLGFIHLQCHNDESSNKRASVWTSSKGFMRFFLTKSKSNLLSMAHKM